MLPAHRLSGVQWTSRCHIGRYSRTTKFTRWNPILFPLSAVEGRSTLLTRNRLLTDRTAPRRAARQEPGRLPDAAPQLAAGHPVPALPANRPPTASPNLHDRDDTTCPVCHGTHGTMPDQQKGSDQVRKDNSLLRAIDRPGRRCCQRTARPAGDSGRVGTRRSGAIRSGGSVHRLPRDAQEGTAVLAVRRSVLGAAWSGASGSAGWRPRAEPPGDGGRSMGRPLPGHHGGLHPPTGVEDLRVVSAGKRLLE